MIMTTNLLEQKCLDKIGGRGRGKYTIMYVCQRRNTSGRAVPKSFEEIQQIDPNHWMIWATMNKKMMELPAKFARSPQLNWRIKKEIGFNVIYATNLSSQNALRGHIFSQMVIAL